jgi:hypothetical protein
MSSHLEINIIPQIGVSFERIAALARYDDDFTSLKKNVVWYYQIYIQDNHVINILNLFQSNYRTKLNFPDQL